MIAELIGVMTRWQGVGASVATKTLHKKRRVDPGPRQHGDLRRTAEEEDDQVREAVEDRLGRRSLGSSTLE